MSNKVLHAAVINTVPIDSTGKIAVGLHRYLLSQSIDSLMCYGRGNHIDDSTYYRIDYPFEYLYHTLMTRIFGNQGSYSLFATKRFIKKLQKRSIDTIFCVSLHGYYLNERLLFEYIAKYNIRVVYIMVDEYPFLGKCCYSNDCNRFMLGCGVCPAIKSYPKTMFFDKSKTIFIHKMNYYCATKRITFVAPKYVVNKALLSPLTKNKTIVELDEAVNLETFYPRDVSMLKKELRIDVVKIVIVCVAPYSFARKGVKYFIELAKRFEHDMRYTFIQVGFDGDKSVLPSNYIPIGYIYDENKLAEYLSIGDLFVFPSLADTMPNACLLSLGCGTPILGFNISGMPYIADETTGTFVDAKNVDALASVVDKTIKKDNSVINKCREYALNRYDARKYNSKLLQIAESL